MHSALCLIALADWTLYPRLELGFPHPDVGDLLRQGDEASLLLRLIEKTRGGLGRIAGAGTDVFAIKSLPPGRPIIARNAGLELSIDSIRNRLAGTPGEVASAA